VKREVPLFRRVVSAGGHMERRLTPSSYSRGCGFVRRTYGLYVLKVLVRTKEPFQLRGVEDP
jgi:hypothetical protein